MATLPGSDGTWPLDILVCSAACWPTPLRRNTPLSRTARLQTVSNARTASLFDSLQKLEDRHALELKNVKDQAELAASQHRAQLARAQAEVARVRKERDRARTDAARYYRERQLARAEVVELRVALLTAVVQQALRPDFPGSPEHE